MFVYKYLESQYLSKFKNEGKLYINTLYNLRSCLAAPSDFISDELEGKYRLKVDLKSKPVGFSNEEARNLSTQATFSKKIAENAITLMPNVIFDKQIPDAYVFCTSTDGNNSVLKKKYNAIFKIIDLLRFADLVNDRLELDGKVSLSGYATGMVTYGIKERSINQKNKQEILTNLPKTFRDYCFKKPLKFRSEHEYRMVFLPKMDVKIQPTEITCPELVKCCLVK